MDKSTLAGERVQETKRKDFAPLPSVTELSANQGAQATAEPAVEP